MANPDQKYINALLTNDKVTLDELYSRFSGSIKRMILQNQGNANDAADIFQEALIAICQRARVGNLILTCPFQSFLYAICRNKWLKELTKRKKSRVTIVDEPGYSISEDCFALAEEIELYERRKELLTQKLAELGDSCKRIIELSLSGISMIEVASKIERTYGYVRKRKSICVAKLVKLIKGADQYNLLKR